MILFFTISYVLIHKDILYTSCIHLALRPNSTSRKLLINLLSTLTQLGWLLRTGWLLRVQLKLLCGDKELISRCANFFSRCNYNLIWQTDKLFCGLRCYFRWPFVPSIYLFFNQGRFAGGDLVFLVLERIMPGTRWCGKNKYPNILYMHHDEIGWEISRHIFKLKFQSTMFVEASWRLGRCDAVWNGESTKGPTKSNSIHHDPGSRSGHRDAQGLFGESQLDFFGTNQGYAEHGVVWFDWHEKTWYIMIDILYIIVDIVLCRMITILCDVYIYIFMRMMYIRQYIYITCIYTMCRVDTLYMFFLTSAKWSCSSLFGRNSC